MILCFPGRVCFLVQTLSFLHYWSQCTVFSLSSPFLNVMFPQVYASFVFHQCEESGRQYIVLRREVEGEDASPWWISKIERGDSREREKRSGGSEGMTEAGL